ncbi:indole-3-glycerol phosphate synthase TrpC [candidate division KSB1 bacterium]|nr:indole-3-glycerol phosphate synthase TrpC [candidate division KSB1 bacterium]
MILNQIVEKVRHRLEEKKKLIHRKVLENQIQEVIEKDVFKDSLRRRGFHFITEIKKASPSAGVICQNFNPVSIAQDYAAAGASAISIITEPDFFQGSLNILEEVRKYVHLPILRKDFIIDPYQLYEARVAGADCVLLIVAILSEKELKNLQKLAKELNLNILVEVHDEKEIPKAINSGAEMIGINNRNLKTFKVDLDTTFRLLPLIPADLLVVSESGIQTREQIRTLEQAGVKAALIGESLMRAADKKALLQHLSGREKSHAC